MDNISLKKINAKIESLSKSKFRNSFHLNQKMKSYVVEKGLDTIKIHANKIISERLKPQNPKNDGKQTPMRQVHPIFVAQHACGFCCRSCLERIHHIPKNKELTNEELSYIVEFIIEWIKKEIN